MLIVHQGKTAMFWSTAVSRVEKSELPTVKLHADLYSTLPSS